MLYVSFLNDIAKHFFAYDHLNYAQLTPLYIADMTKLEENDKDTCAYLKKKLQCMDEWGTIYFHKFRSRNGPGK